MQSKTSTEMVPGVVRVGVKKLKAIWPFAGQFISHKATAAAAAAAATATLASASARLITNFLFIAHAWQLL